MAGEKRVEFGQCDFLDIAEALVPVAVDQLDQMAGGWGARTVRPDQHALGKGVWRDGLWRVVITRPMVSDDLNAPQLTPGARTVAAFAVFGKLTFADPLLGTLAASTIGKVFPPSAESEILTLAQLIDPASEPATFHVTVCGDPPAIVPAELSAPVMANGPAVETELTVVDA